ncbi:hypothetical protein HK104_006078, partial [Borealophlyctis nickersoniae]
MAQVEPHPTPDDKPRRKPVDYTALHDTLFKERHSADVARDGYLPGGEWVGMVVEVEKGRRGSADHDRKLLSGAPTFTPNVGKLSNAIRSMAVRLRKPEKEVSQNNGGSNGGAGVGPAAVAAASAPSSTTAVNGGSQATLPRKPVVKQAESVESVEKEKEKVLEKEKEKVVEKEKEKVVEKEKEKVRAPPSEVGESKLEAVPDVPVQKIQQKEAVDEKLEQEHEKEMPNKEQEEVVAESVEVERTILTPIPEVVEPSSPQETSSTSAPAGPSSTPSDSQP